MPTDDDLAPLQPRQFRLRAVIGGMTVCCVALSIVRLLPEPPNPSPESVVFGLIFVGLLLGLNYLMARGIDDGGPLLAGALGTLCGGPAFGVLVVAYSGGGAEAMPFMFLAMLVGLFWAGLFLIGGILSALVWGAIRGRADVWSGVLCGGATGYFTLFPFAADGPDARYVYVCLFPALVGATFGGFASAVQIHHAELRKHRRLATMPKVDLSDVSLNELVAPTPTEHSPKPAVLP